MTSEILFWRKSDVFVKKNLVIENDVAWQTLVSHASIPIGDGRGCDGPG